VSQVVELVKNDRVLSGLAHLAKSGLKEDKSPALAEIIISSYEHPQAGWH
jgi:hypothetical protein